MSVLSVSFFCFQQKTAYEVRISAWSSDVCSSGLVFRSFRRRDEPSETVHARTKLGARPLMQPPRRQRGSFVCTKLWQGWILSGTPGIFSRPLLVKQFIRRFE